MNKKVSYTYQYLSRTEYYNIEKGGLKMENWKKDSRKDIVMVDVDALVPQDHLL